MRNSNFKLYTFVSCGVLSIMFLVLKITESGKDASEEAVFVGDDEKFKVCQSTYDRNEIEDQKTIFIVTPTYSRPEQIAELTRLAQTLLHLKTVHWIVAEDQPECSDLVSSVLKRLPEFSYTQLAAPMPSLYLTKHSLKHYGLPRGVAGRRASLKWILSNTSQYTKAVVYFADDDNTYDLRLFNDLLAVSHGQVGMLPVGLIRPWGVTTPILGPRGRVVGFIPAPDAARKFPIDMAGFVTHLSLVHDKKPLMPYRATFEEDGFLRALNISYRDIVPLAKNCTEIYVWHTMTMAPSIQLSKSVSDLKDLKTSNVGPLLNNMKKTGLLFF